ncbi:MAG: 1-acyl-sn-glycerol-3-phosphate acyltransferase [Desulfobacteraceae bacterium]|nr:1-acyl-sn-glycerol-3-phosphate acyltransferase [Desulfobacteraceae bacterium]
MPNLINLIIYILYFSFIGLSSVLFFFVALVIRIVCFPFDKKLIVSNLFSSFWASCYLWCIPTWSVKKSGREKVSLKKNYIIVSNHQSQVDIFLAFNLFIPFRWISKKEVFNLPFIGWNMVLNKYIGIKRGDKESIEKMMRQCESILEQGCSLFFFPEGTRSKTGELRAFKPGAFILAKKMKINILPVVMQGTREILSKNSAKVSWNKEISIKILDEINYNDFEDMSVQETAQMVHDLFKKNLKEN